MDLVFTISLKRSTPNLQLSTSRRPITPSHEGRSGSVGIGTNSTLVSSRPEESHRRALPKPCVNLSIHTAPDVRPFP